MTDFALPGRAARLSSMASSRGSENPAPRLASAPTGKVRSGSKNVMAANGVLASGGISWTLPSERTW